MAKRRRPRQFIGPMDLKCSECDNTVGICRIDQSAPFGTCCGYLYIGPSPAHNVIDESGFRVHQIHMNQIAAVFWHDRELDLQIGKTYHFRRIYTEEPLKTQYKGTFEGMRLNRDKGIQLLFRIPGQGVQHIEPFQIRDIREIGTISN